MRLRASANVADPIGASAEHNGGLIGIDRQSTCAGSSVGIDDAKSTGVGEDRIDGANRNHLEPAIDVVGRVRQMHEHGPIGSGGRTNNQNAIIPIGGIIALIDGGCLEVTRRFAAKQLVLNVRGDTSNARLLGWSGLTALVFLAGGCTSQERKARRNKQEFLHVS